MTSEPPIDWTRDELILACDLLRGNGWRELRQSDERVIALSQVLRRPWLHPLEGRPVNFRSPGSVARKTSNLATHVPGYQGAKTKGGRLDLVVLEDFLADPDTMALIAAAITLAIANGHIAHAEVDDEDVAGSREGALLQALVSRRERDPKLRRKKIDMVKAKGGLIACEACGFDFEQRYGERGRGYIEVHHRRPLYATGTVTTKLADLALLCANCHRMIHRRNWISVEDLMGLLEV